MNPLKLEELMKENKRIPCQNDLCPCKKENGSSIENVRYSVVKKVLKEGGKLHCHKCHKGFKCIGCKYTMQTLKLCKYWKPSGDQLENPWKSWDQLERWENPWDESKEWNAWVSHLLCKECCRCDHCGELMDNCTKVTGRKVHVGI
jgi:hypothetical protein